MEDDEEINIKWLVVIVVAEHEAHMGEMRYVCTILIGKSEYIGDHVGYLDVNERIL
jgi:hypothetical protein